MRSIHSFSMTSSMSGDFMESPLKFTWSPVGQVAQITRRYLAFSIYGVSFWSISSPHHLSSSSSRSAISTRWPPTTTNHDNKPSAPTNRHRLYPSKCFLPPHSMVCLQTASEHLALHLPLPTCATSSHKKHVLYRGAGLTKGVGRPPYNHEKSLSSRNNPYTTIRIWQMQATDHHLSFAFDLIWLLLWFDLIWFDCVDWIVLIGLCWICFERWRGWRLFYC